MIYAVDFDGTLCEDAYPEIGAPRTEIIEKCKHIQAAGGKLILWTCRTGHMLEEAIKWTGRQGLSWDAINENLPERIEEYGGDCRKISADFYIDDKAEVPTGGTTSTELAIGVLLSQRKKGIAKYGRELTIDTDKTPRELVQDALEECADMMSYLACLAQKLSVDGIDTTE